MKSDFGIIGMGVMGSNLARNIARKGYKVSLYNRHVSGSEEAVAQGIKSEFPEFDTSEAFDDIAQFVDSLSAPRKMLIMVKAGAAVDAVINELSPILNQGDIIIDGGNSFFEDTNRRFDELAKMGIHFIGMGVSGGEEGALNGPAMMPGGDDQAIAKVSDILNATAAKNKDGFACCARTGRGGSGHFVKMIHNGIEYAEMQLLAECYDIMRLVHGMDNEAIHSVFNDWNQGELGSYLLEITADIFNKKEEAGYVLDTILDQASNKGTGAWTSIEGIKMGIPFNIISSALYARYISAHKDDRVAVSGQLAQQEKYGANGSTIEHLKSAYHMARMLNHLQGIKYMQTASEQYDWDLSLSNIAKSWTAGCIIRSELMYLIVDQIQDQDNLWLHKDWLSSFEAKKTALKTVCSTAMQDEIPIPTFTACLNYFNGMKQGRSSANLIQAQRDYFGAHTYKKLDDPNGPSHHTNWINT